VTALEAWEKERERKIHVDPPGGQRRVGSCRELEAERDRLREALDRILKCTLPVPMQDIARAALEEGGQDE
jgi:hypothetical protein